MQQFFLIMQIAGAIFPLVFEAIQKFEIPGLSGAEKLQAVTDLVVAVLNAGLLPESIRAKIKADQINMLVPAITNMVVLFLNVKGVFTTKKTTITVTTP